MVHLFPPNDAASQPRSSVLGLLRPMAAAGLVLMVLTGGIIGWLHYQSCLSLITDQARRMGQDMTQMLASWSADAPFGSSAMTLPQLLSDASTLRIDTQRRLDNRLLQVSDVLPILKVALYDPHGNLVYSTDDGVRNASVAIQRTPVSLAPSQVKLGDEGFVDLQTFVFAGRTLSSTDAYHVVLPLTVPETGDMAGTVDVYVDLQEQVAHLAANTTWMATVLGVSFLALYGGLVILIHRLYTASALSQEAVHTAQAALQESEAHLSRVQDAMENTITERTLRLKQSEARFREFAESASDWLWECDQGARVTYISEGFTRIMGIDRSAVVGRFRWDLSDLSEDDEKWIAHREAIASMKPFRDFTYTFRLPNNKRRVVSLNGTPIFDERANFHGFRGTGSDITLQHAAEQTILHLGRILEQSANEVLIFEDGALRLLQANRGARQNLGYAIDELALMTILDILPTESRPSLESRLGRLRLYPSELVVFESVFERKDKTRYPIEARVQYMAEEKPPVFVAVMQNITARKQAEQALAESEERYRSVAEMSMDALIVHVDGIIVFANQQATIIAHADQAKAMIGQPIQAFVAADQDRPQNITALFSPQPATHDGAPTYQRIEVRLRRLDGTSFDAELSSSPITFGGRPAVQTVLRDITQSKIVQGQLIQTAKLATLGEMAAGMAHELSQPMNVIRMAAEGAMLERTDGSSLDHASQAALNIISGQAARMGEIIDHMRIFSRKQTDDVDLFNPVASVQQSVSMLESQLRAEDIQLEVKDHLAPQQPIWVKGRPVHLEQVVLNLLTNARDALRSRLRSEPMGASAWQASIVISLTQENMASQDNDSGEAGGLGSQSWLHIMVQDTGGGIPAEHLDRIFEPFYTTKEVGTGTGLGLSVSFSLISAMGGALTACNQGDGACFEIRLPLADPQPGTMIQEAVPGQGAWQDRSFVVAKRHDLPIEDANGEDDDEPSALIPHIMVVDDEPFATSLVKEHLVRLGYRVSTAVDGEDAFEQFLDDPPDLMITDLRMPRCGGAELIERVHQHVPELPVIVATGHLGHLETAAAELQDVTVAVIKKPISLAELGALVARALNGERGA